MLMFFGIVGIVSLWLVPTFLMLYYASVVDKESKLGGKVIALIAAMYLLLFLFTTICLTYGG